jgi:hypothetical protein
MVPPCGVQGMQLVYTPMSRVPCVIELGLWQDIWYPNSQADKDQGNCVREPGATHKHGCR